ncbi:hypothetical protein [Methylobrevis pamukkalensis]|uniref:Uncharacterized protein n=1 Tax=Methylobrevis pamukkalensis TaxID=1439726 RepID=A0A1E3H299_9HYPH|nr:hypothetical protein [Methylobrevis pamukkalensis]ODN69661.1 hypothetical protein A6302_03039 [Methylobrevis pamukkalensis]
MTMHSASLADGTPYRAAGYAPPAGSLLAGLPRQVVRAVRADLPVYLMIAAYALAGLGWASRHGGIDPALFSTYLLAYLATRWC